MARLAGSNKHYILAKRIVDAALKYEEWTSKNLQKALETLSELMNNPETAAATRQTIATFIVKEHAKHAKQYGRFPKPKDFIDKEALEEKKVQEDVGIISLEFNEKVG